MVGAKFFTPSAIMCTLTHWSIAPLSQHRCCGPQSWVMSLVQSPFFVGNCIWRWNGSMCPLASGPTPGW
jgi:hypothetical protein